MVKIERENSKTLILKDSSVRSIWTYLTASPTNTNMRKRERKCDYIYWLVGWLVVVFFGCFCQRDTTPPIPRAVVVVLADAVV